MRLITLLLFIGTAFLAGCGLSNDIGHGYRLVDGGGSKMSLTKNGLVIINYTVTGDGIVDGYVIIENRSYDAKNCNYFVIDKISGALIKIENSLKFGDVEVNQNNAINYLKYSNSKSCKNNGVIP